MVWNRAWELESVYWSIQFKSYQCFKILNGLCHPPNYLSWWQLSDTLPELICICEDMVKIVCRCSLLKCDDVRLKGLTNSARWCDLCDLAEEENIFNCIMQCPSFHQTRIYVLEDIRMIDNGCDKLFLDTHQDITPILMGASIPSFTFKDMAAIWTISGTYIRAM